MTGRGARYRVDWAPEAWDELHRLTVFERRPVMRAADELAYEAEVETRNRKPLRRPLEDLPGATWELRVRSRYRLLYGVYRIIEDPNGQGTVEILRVIIKDRETTETALGSE